MRARRRRGDDGPVQRWSDLPSSPGSSKADGEGLPARRPGVSLPQAILFGRAGASVICRRSPAIAQLCLLTTAELLNTSAGQPVAGSSARITSIFCAMR